MRSLLNKKCSAVTKPRIAISLEPDMISSAPVAARNRPTIIATPISTALFCLFVY